MLDAGCDVNASHSTRKHSIPCALSSTCAEGNLDFVLLLVRRGANATYRHSEVGSRAWNPIDMAAYYGHQDIVELLLEDGAELRPAFVRANRGQHTSLVVWLCKRYPEILHFPSHSIHRLTLGYDAVVEAVYNFNRPLLQVLLDAGLYFFNPEYEPRLVSAVERVGYPATKILQFEYGLDEDSAKNPVDG